VFVLLCFNEKSPGAEAAASRFDSNPDFALGAAEVSCCVEYALATARPYWKGYLKLSLVSCPLALYPAISTAEGIVSAG
jgi:hypothetical protein